MKSISVKTIHGQIVWSEAVYLDSQFILADPAIGLSNATLHALKEWEFTEVLTEGEWNVKEAAVKKKEMAVEAILSTKPAGDEAKIDKASELYETLKNYMETLFVQVAKENKLDYNELSALIAGVVPVIKEHKHFLMRAQNAPPLEKEEGYQASHAVRCMIISMIIGNYLKFSDTRLVELGIAALLHEIGMTKIPPVSKGYYNKRPLTQDERKAIFSHPVFSYTVLKSFNAPLAVCLAGLEHHERENGSGYPQKLTGDKISLYAKIIAVACSYEALTANRPYRDAKDAYSGMYTVIKNEGKQYDPTIVKALLYSLSLYPVGLYVLLSNGKKGQVVDIDPANPFYPIVQIFGLFTPEGDKVAAQTSKNGIFIVRPLRKDEMAS
ncbi:MAG: HD-GYP domain-containing protein [Treponema sp.]|jgi:HD-GYP domain-containing protein (c-di-GMP phosphodiesterase class II)|nr:HD-GYP domain-containing protein [Treponema sp.]